MSYFTIVEIVALFTGKDSFRYNFDGYLKTFIKFLLNSTKPLIDTVQKAWNMVWLLFVVLLKVFNKSLVNFIDDLYQKVKKLFIGKVSMNDLVAQIQRINSTSDEESEMDFGFLADLFKHDANIVK